MQSTETTTTDETYEKKTVVNRWDRTLIILACFFLFISSVLNGVTVYRQTKGNERIDHIDVIVNKAKTAAESAKTTVDDVVAQSKTPEALAQSAAIIAALSQIKQIQEAVDEINMTLQNK